MRRWVGFLTGLGLWSLSCGGKVEGPALATLAFENHQSSSGSVSSFQGVFHPDAQHASGGCTTAGEGACVVWTCSPSTSSAIGAGVLTLSNGTGSLGDVAQGTDGTYGDAVPSFAKGDVLGVAASGGEAPAFATQTVVAPGPITVTSPPAPLAFSRASDATLAWSGGEPDARVFFELPGSGAGTSNFALCSFDAAAGSGVIPQATLAAVHPAQHTVVLWWQERSATFVAGTYPIEVIARQSSGASATFE